MKNSKGKELVEKPFDEIDESEPLDVLKIAEAIVAEFAAKKIPKRVGYTALMHILAKGWLLDKFPFENLIASLSRLYVNLKKESPNE